MGAGPGEGLERRLLGLGLGRPGRRFALRDPLGVRVLLLVQSLNIEPIELLWPSGEVLGTNVFAREVVGTEVSDEAFSGRGLPERPSRSLLN